MASVHVPTVASEGARSVHAPLTHLPHPARAQHVFLNLPLQVTSAHTTFAEWQLVPSQLHAPIAV